MGWGEVSLALSCGRELKTQHLPKGSLGSPSTESPPRMAPRASKFLDIQTPRQLTTSYEFLAQSLHPCDKP